MRRLLFLFPIFALTATYAQAPRHLDPGFVAIGKELPRGDVVSHDSRAEAILDEYHASKYLQPLTGWTATETAEAVTFKTRYKIPFDWIDRRQFLYLGRVSGSFDVLINGAFAAYSQTGSTPAEFDITDVSEEGANELEIVVYKNPVAQKLEDNRATVAPQIEGEAYILSQPGMRVRDIDVSTRMEGTSGLLELGVIMKSHKLNVRDYTVWWELLSPHGEVVAEGHKEAVLDMRREDTVHFFANIPRIVTWSHEEPRLYTLFIKTQNEGRFREYLAFRVGFRSLDVQDGLVRLNGVPLRLVMRDFTPPRTIAEARAQIEALKTEGVNALRLRGVPPSREFYAMCDELGMYLCGEADIDTHLSGDSRKVGGNPSNDPLWEGAYLDRVMSMYHISRNNPSMVMFSLAERSANGYNLYESYLALKSKERHRPVLYTEGGEWNTDRLDLETMETIPDGVGGQWAILTADNAVEGRFVVENPRRFTPLIGQADYRIMVGKKAVSQGVVPLEIPAGGAWKFVVPVTGVKEGKKYSIHIDVRVESSDNSYVPVDGELKVFRRADGTISEAHSIVVASGDFPVER